MKDTIALLDRFIKDTTHELNTPVNAILTNIEMIDEQSLDESLLKKIKRITIASKTISNLYDDLTYLVLSHQILSQDVEIDLKVLIEERLEYFSLLFESKKIELFTELAEGVVLTIDRKKMAKLIDNILSNAIKDIVRQASAGPQYKAIEEDGVELMGYTTWAPIDLLSNSTKPVVKPVMLPSILESSSSLSNTSATTLDMGFGPCAFALLLCCSAIWKILVSAKSKISLTLRPLVS